MDPLQIFKKICYMWLYGYFLNKSDPEDTSIEIAVWFLIVMLFNLLISTISRFTSGRKRKGCSFQALEAFHYFILFLRICAVPTFYEEYFEVSLISILSLIAQCFLSLYMLIAVYTGNEFTQAPSRISSSLNLNLEDSFWEKEVERYEMKEMEKEEFAKSMKGGTSI